MCILLQQSHYCVRSMSNFVKFSRFYIEYTCSKKFQNIIQIMTAQKLDVIEKEL